ncbi:Mv-ORF10 peptide [Maruca vitrata nucleopolyhedrovirus]|uniref:Mv-ORF10 peptide n=1 Tax=Maruca vitrata nucleopolyhedrovirus TaxID=1307954 RepID=A1YR72_9ABAC|nr:Mv-ORF10 peptide [Maruca vitrata nucleopolyhedrovirus]ABL75962.1 Mv-ORF10 peptide [Maruca vitrata nucleopolyhedrovirus]
MERLLNQLNLGVLPYITTKDIEDRLRDKIVARAKLSFIKECFEVVVCENDAGLFVLTGGAAVTCHIDDDKSALKCLDFDYYGLCPKAFCDLQINLQNCVDRHYDELDVLTRQVHMADPLVVLKCYQNGAYKLNGQINLHLNRYIKCIKTQYNDEFDLVRFALQVDITCADGVDEISNAVTRATVSFNVFFVNVRIMKRPFNTDRCIKKFSLFGNRYQVLVLSLQRVLNDQLMCLLKDIFTNKFDYKIERRLKHLKCLFANLPAEFYNSCVNDHTDMCLYKKQNETITNFVRKVLDINGPALGCRKLMHVYLTTDTFSGQLPDYLTHYVNYPHKSLCDQNWKRFMSCIFSLY